MSETLLRSSKFRPAGQMELSESASIHVQTGEAPDFRNEKQILVSSPFEYQNLRKLVATQR